MSSVSSKKVQRAGGLRLKGTFIDVVNNDMDSPRALSDPGSTRASSCYFESELRYVEELSSAMTSLNSVRDSADGSSSNEAETSPKDSFHVFEEVQEGFEYATQSMNTVLHSLGETDCMHLTKSLFVRATSTSDVLQAARDVVNERMERANHKVVHQDMSGTLANDAVADALFRAKAGCDSGSARDQSVAIEAADVSSTLANEAVADALLRAKAGCDSSRARGQSLAIEEALPDKFFPIGADSCGSLGHPEMCARPCIYFALEGCTKGDSCGFCHLPHYPKVAHLDKKGREQIKIMTLEQRVATLLPSVRQKVISLRLHQDCVRAIDDILASQPHDAHVGQNIMGHIQRGGYKKFSLRALMGMLKPSTDGESLDLQNKLRDLSRLLRSCCATSAA